MIFGMERACSSVENESIYCLIHCELNNFRLRYQSFLSRIGIELCKMRELNCIPLDALNYDVSVDQSLPMHVVLLSLFLEFLLALAEIGGETRCT